MIRRLAALVLLLAAACGGPSVRELPREQSRYDALNITGLRGLRDARALLASGHAEEALVEISALRVEDPECVYLALWQQEAEISARGLESVWPGSGAGTPASSEQEAAMEQLRATWRARAESGGVVELVAAARLEQDPAAARALLERAAKLDPKCAWIPYARAFLAAQDDDWTAVQNELGRSVALDPAHLPTFWLEAWTLARGGDPQAASLALERWAERARGDPRIDEHLVQGAELDIAVLSVIVGEPKVAREWLDLLESELPGESRALCARACAEQALDHIDSALKLVRAAHEAAPNALLPLVQEALIWEHWKKDPQQAEEAWSAVLTAARSSPELGALFERLRARVVLDREAKAAAKPAPPEGAPDTP
ncbi:MAG: hypothetical protein IPJ19_10315 [Planctomycetes bacterium]|nr:hypothetical protein [Planctomycetota bacterium]